MEEHLTADQFLIYIGRLAGWINPWFATNPECEGFSTTEARAMVLADCLTKCISLATVIIEAGHLEVGTPHQEVR